MTVMIWFSITLGLIFEGPFENSFIYPGGLHGYNVSRWFCSQIGTPGLILALLVTAILFCVALTSKTMPFVRKALRPNLRRKGNDPQPADPEQPDEPRPTAPTATTPEPEIQEEKTEDIPAKKTSETYAASSSTPSPKVTEVYEEEEDNDKNEPQPKAHEIELSLDETPARESKASDMRV